MKILLTGATGYIGKRLLPVLLNQGHQVICCVRSRKRFSLPADLIKKVEILEIDFLDLPPIESLPRDIDAAYFLIHSMTSSTDNFDSLEAKAANNFKAYVEHTSIKQVIFLGGIANEDVLSKHLASRKRVELILESEKYELTVLRAGIIVGSGSASFEIIRDLVEKLPIMVTPKWVNTKSQPIAVKDVVAYLSQVLGKKETFGESFDIGGPEVLTYKQMLLQFAEERGLKRYIITLPVLTPKLSSYWLFFVTSISFKLAVNLVDSMKMEVICKNNDLEKILEIIPISYREAINRAFQVTEQNMVPSSWKDSFVSSGINMDISHFVEVPVFGCYKDKQIFKVRNVTNTVDKIWSIGGKRGWYFANWLWKFRGYLDKLAGGIGLRRGRTRPYDIQAGDALDFWRVIYANKQEKRLLLFAEMKLPGEAWLEFKIDEKQNLHQTATFRPKGLLGRLYWWSVVPFHLIIFKGLAKYLAR